jgi:hypothetical protein
MSDLRPNRHGGWIGHRSVASPDSVQVLLAPGYAVAPVPGGSVTVEFTTWVDSPGLYHALLYGTDPSWWPPPHRLRDWPARLWHIVRHEYRLAG